MKGRENYGDEYLFIDGNYLTLAYRAVMSSYFGEDTARDFKINFDQLRRSARARKVFYYDAVDLQSKPGETEENTKHRLESQKRALEGLNALDGFHVKLGSVSTGRKRQQKEVDVLIAVDMLSHAFSKNTESATLLAGDRDFKPLVEALVNHGTYATVIYEKTSGSRELYIAADRAVRVGIHDFLMWTEGHERLLPLLPEPYAAPLPMGTHFNIARWNGKLFQLMSHGGKVFMISPDVLQYPLVFHDTYKLVRYVEMAHNCHLEWEKPIPDPLEAEPKA